MGAWIYLGSLTGDHYVTGYFQTDGPNFGRVSIGVTGDKVFLAVVDGATSETIVGTTSLTINTWHYISAEHKGNDRRVYLDGVEENTSSATVNVDPANLQSTMIGAGDSSVGIFDGVLGYIGHVAHWNMLTAGLLDHAALAAGISPLFYDSTSLELKHYWIMDRADVFRDVSSGQVLNIGGLPILWELDAAPVYEPQAPQIAFNYIGPDTKSGGVNPYIYFAPTVTYTKIHAANVTPTFTPTTVANQETQNTASVSLILTPDADSQIKQFTGSPSAAFAPTAARNVEKVAVASVFFNFYNTIDGVATSLDASLTLTPTTVANQICSHTALVALSLKAEAFKSEAGAANSTLTFDANTAIFLNHALPNFAVTASATVIPASSRLFDTLTLAAAATANVIKNVTANPKLEFLETMGAPGTVPGARIIYSLASALGPDNCSSNLHDPTDLVFTAQDSAETLTIRAPDFGDTAVVTVPMSSQQMMDRSRRTHLRRNSYKNTRFSYTISDVTQAKAQEVLTFVEDNLGDEVTFQDSTSRNWKGVITNPKDIIIRNERGGTCGYSVSLTFVGTELT
jgi:hypothetical protein